MVHWIRNLRRATRRNIHLMALFFCSFTYTYSKSFIQKGIFMRSHFSTLSKYFPFFILAVSFSAGSIVGSARTHFSFSQTTSSSPVASILSASENWGLSFQEEGKRPVGNATIQELAEYHAFFAADTAEKKLYLTFDCGYENGNTPAILAALKKHQAPAVFFAVGNFVRDNPDLIKQMVAEGHIVGNHTMTHP